MADATMGTLTIYPQHSPDEAMLTVYDQDNKPGMIFTYGGDLILKGHKLIGRNDGVLRRLWRLLTWKPEPEGKV
ncbi:MAG: hypothetical protein WC683_05850 [bacterium]